jgi:phosphoribosylaminoimidazole-succinocarboxamide synthase
MNTFPVIIFPTAYAFTEGENTLVLDHYDPLNFHVKIQNIAGKRISKIFGVREFSEITIPLYEFFLDDEEKFVLSENHLNSFLLLTNEEYKMILRISSKVNAVLKSFFERRGFVLATANLKYGR